MKKVFLGLMVCAGAAGMLLTGCTTNDEYDPEAINALYEDTWSSTFGDIDANQTWNTATQVTANIDLSDYSGTYTVNVYTANPATESTYLLAKSEMSGTGSLTFDAPQSLEQIFITAENADGKVLNSYYTVNGSTVSVTRAQTRSTCSVTRGEISTDSGTVWDESYQGAQEWDHNRPYSTKYAKLQGVTKSEGTTWKGKDWLDIVGHNGIFEEFEHNLTKWREELGTEVEYVTSEDGPITLSLSYGATINTYNVGYYYYAEDENPDDAVRYILFEKYNPADYITINGDALTGGMQLGALGNEDPGEYYLNASIQGSKVNLVYFEDDGTTGTYDFPAGTHIAFFISKSSDSDFDWDNTFNSITDVTYSPYCYDDVSHIHTCAVTYKYNKQLLLGFEDGTDWDMNDLLCFVNGDFEGTDEIVDLYEGEEDVEPMPYVIACEDLGGTFDYDFNDVVFAVSYTSGDETATIIPLSAGGIMKAEIYYNSTLVGEIHEMLGSEDYTVMLNTDSYTPGTSETITVGSDFSMTNDLGNFKIQIYKNDIPTAAIEKPGTGETPQMLCIAAKWAWPTPGTNIEKAYTKFGNWGANYNSDIDWYNYPTEGLVIEW